VKGVLTVESGVEKENIEKTKAAVLRELDDMKNGIITDDEIDNAKRSLNTAYLSVTDSLSQLQGWYINRMLIDNFSTPEQEAEKINAVTKEQIIEAAQKLTLDTVYVLTGTDETEGK
ncbi:MAG: insulinase family protein, partial [Clostridia bacterium]|nr:insulinase family protein [Clostridia bacterium]